MSGFVSVNSVSELCVLCGKSIARLARHNGFRVTLVTHMTSQAPPPVSSRVSEERQ